MSIVLDDGTGAIVQQSTNRATFITSVVTTAATSTTPFGFATAAQADALVARVNSLIALAIAQGQMKAS